LKRLAPAAAVLLIAIGISFTPALRAKYTNWDDVDYVGSARKPVRSLVTDIVTGHYHPLTMLSLGLDVRLFGMSATEMHAMNVALHAATSLLVLLLLFQLTGSVRGALAGALFFAIHPLRVESVAWVSARKDVLMGVFFAAALLTYLAHLRRGVSIGWTYLLFVLAILSKANAITLPFGLLLLDVAEQGRARFLDKIAFFIISIAGAIEATLAIHSQGGTLTQFHFTAGQRMLLVGRALVMYAAREIVPLNLSAYYRYHATIEAADSLSFIAVVCLAIALLASVRRFPRLVAGIAFFVLTIAPMLPLMATGNTIGADRYTYMPSIGLAFVVATGVALLSARSAIVLLVAGGAILGTLTWLRCEVWHDAETLWQSVIDDDPNVPIAWNNLGHARISDGDRRGAFLFFTRAIELNPCYFTALRSHALELDLIGQYELEMRDIDQMIRCDPNNPVAWKMKSDVLKKIGHAAEGNGR